MEFNWITHVAIPLIGGAIIGFVVAAAVSAIYRR